MEEKLEDERTEMERCYYGERGPFGGGILNVWTPNMEKVEEENVKLTEL